MTSIEFANIFEPHREAAFNWLRFRVRDKSTCEDIIQDTFLNLWRHRNRYKEQGNSKAFILKIVRNNFINYLRSQKQKNITEYEPYKDNRTYHQEHQQSNPTFEALMGLEHWLFEPIYEVDVLGNTYQQAAKSIGCPEGTVKSRVYRGRERLKAILKEYALKEYNIK